MYMSTHLPMYVFTSQIPTIVISQAGIEPLTVRLMDGQKTLLETTLYPLAGQIKLYDIGKIYEVATRNRLIVDSVVDFSVLGRCKLVYPYRRNCHSAREGVGGH